MNASSGTVLGQDDEPLGDASPKEVKFEYALMLWYSAFMFVVSGTLFALYAIERWRQRSPVWLVKGFEVAAYSTLYFAFSVTLVVYNKWLIAVWEGGFTFPLTITMVHMALKMVMSWTVVKGCSARNEVPRVSRWTYYLYACPVGATTALDVAASNASLFYVSVTLFTVIKSTSLVFVLFYSVLYRLQNCSVSLFAVTGIIFAGVLMASYGDALFDALGFTLVFAASAIGGYRWALTEVLMQRIGTKMSSLMTIYTISPASVLALLPFAAWLEWGNLLASKFYSDPGLFVLAIINVAGSGVFAFAMIYVELAVLNRTSSLSLVVIGYFKQMAQIIVSVIVFHDVLSPLNIAGIIITFLGTGLYARVKHVQHEKGTTIRQPSRKRRTINAREVDETHIPFANAMDDGQSSTKENGIANDSTIIEDVTSVPHASGAIVDAMDSTFVDVALDVEAVEAKPGPKRQKGRPKHQEYEVVDSNL